MIRGEARSDAARSDALIHGDGDKADRQVGRSPARRKFYGFKVADPGSSLSNRRRGSGSFDRLNRPRRKLFG
jgi:hypothetical protein